MHSNDPKDLDKVKCNEQEFVAPRFLVKNRN